MRIPVRREQVIGLARFALLFEGAALAVASGLAAIHAALTRSPFLDSFFLMAFLVFFVIFVYAILSGPGMFLSRPKFAAMGPEGRRRWRRWLAAPPIGTDREFYELVLYTGLAFLLLAIATALGGIAQALGG